MLSSLISTTALVWPVLFSSQLSCSLLAKEPPYKPLVGGSSVGSSCWTSQAKYDCRKHLKVVDLSFRNNWGVGLTADFPLPFSPQRKLRRWLGLKLYTCKSIFQVGLSFSPQNLLPRGTWSSSTWPRGSCQPSSPTPSPPSQPISIWIISNHERWSLPAKYFHHRRSPCCWAPPPSHLPSSSYWHCLSNRWQRPLKVLKR